MAYAGGEHRPKAEYFCNVKKCTDCDRITVKSNADGNIFEPHLHCHLDHKGCGSFKPIIQSFWEYAYLELILNADETPVKVSKQSGKLAKKMG